MNTTLFITIDTGTAYIEGTPQNEHHEIVCYNKLVPSKIAIKVLKQGKNRSPAHIRVYNIQEVTSIGRIMIELKCLEQMRIPLQKPSNGYIVDLKSLTKE